MSPSSTLPRPVALVTGGSRGIGAGIATELAHDGFDVAITAMDDDGEALAAIRNAGARALGLRSDLSDLADHARVLDAVMAWGGGIACLVNNAGIGSPRRGDLLDVTPEAYDKVLDTNLRGTFFFTQAVARQMAATPASGPRAIVTVSSVSASLASIERGEYCLSKAGLGMLSKLFALRLAPLGIAVFDVRPGVIRTPMTEGVAGKYDQLIADGLVPMGRWGYPEDVARVVSALAGGRLAFATGSVINVDGALSIPRL
ncbi:3-ketoacyl-ACP reductase [Variovorax sp. WS11]|uniref:3-ketoacyl-ACP reductase n=1 Tax=Variovorax sp. WS11 TaxID=1105204 RepID=UPI000D0D7089|nr:3-ketoacyl-ACP reductase [Variovorax sp. WS11]NDZ17440.1 3-ketoacyl-ACP reductase [Variovorax sp. WS11]PSL86024.1 3-ketoacyl-ACP reductase [Variovorax sp. WS11]